MARPASRFLPLARPVALGLLLLTAACASQPTKPVPAPPPPPPAPAAPVPPAPPPTGGDEKFQTFIRDFESVALAHGVTRETYDKAMTGIAPIASVAASNLNQPEFSRPIWLYLDSAVSARRIADAKFLLAQYGPVLSAIEGRSGVPKEILVAIWGMESDYGRDGAGLNIFAALATLAYDGPRQDFARTELLAALQILQAQNYAVSDMVASWAGAFGQTQFTPTNFLKYATDGDGDGRIDLWHSPADALASAAELLKQSGWAAGKGWGYEVTLPAGFVYEDADLDIEKPLSEWRARGVTLASGAALPSFDASGGEDTASIYLPAGARGPAILVLGNFKIILKYNNAASYALAVAELADRMEDRPGIAASWPRDERSLSRTERQRFQSELKSLGYDPGEPDGVLGRRTRAALRQYQKAHAMAADGFPTAALLDKLDAETKS
jgi:membrane-bound lytic murein transglycosylase B